MLPRRPRRTMANPRSGTVMLLLALATFCLLRATAVGEGRRKAGKGGRSLLACCIVVAEGREPPARRSTPRRHSVPGWALGRELQG